MSLKSRISLWTVGGLALFTAIILYVFGPVLPGWMAPITPDAMPWFPFGNRTRMLEHLLTSGGTVTPQALYWLLLPPLLANKLTYMLDTLMLTLAGVYYLRGRKTGQAAAWLGGLALGFSGYSFTLFSAGHRGYFHMMGLTVFVFGLLARCFQGRRVFHFVMLGTCLAWSFTYQPDVFAMIMMLAAAYALWLTFARDAAPDAPRQRLARVYPRFLLSLGVALVIAWPSLTGMLINQLAMRREQLAQASAGRPAETAAGASDVAAAKKMDQWIFATNWSLPPEDIFEFVAPGLFGNESFQPPHPYWGRLGRPYGWQPGQPPFPNYRQHTVYLGVAQLVFACLALWAWRRRRTAAAAPEPDAATAPLADVPFWAAASLICLLLSLGRYAPFYRLFYAIPYMDLVRCPVKFHHLVEICVAFLFGLGVHAWTQTRETPDMRVNGSPARRAAWFATILGALLLLAAGLGALARDALADHIRQLGLAPYARQLADYLAANLLRGALLACGVAALLWLGRRAARPAGWLLAVLTLLLAADLASVGRRYLRPLDVGPFYAANIVTDAMLRQDAIGGTVANYATGNNPERDWFAAAILRNGMNLALPADAAAPQARLAQALSRRPEIFWRASHVRYVILKGAMAEPLLRSGVLRPVVFFTLGQGVVRTAAPAGDAFVLAEYARALPDAYLLDGWQGGADEAAQMRTIEAAEWDPIAGVVSDAPSGTTNDAPGRMIGPARMTRRRGWDFKLTTRVEADTPQAALLVLDERFAPDLEVRVNGRIRPARRANGIWLAVELPAGRHAIAIRRRQSLAWPAISAGVGLWVALWGLLRLGLARPAPAPATPRPKDA